MSLLNSTHTVADEQGPYHAKARVMTHQMCQEHGDKMDVSVSKQSVNVLHQMVLGLVETMTMDLETFAAHARRKTINAEDVMLLARRSDTLREHLESLRETEAPSKKRKKKVVSDDEDDE
eukprot:TRINITY_DN12539_c0_g1_i2.p1 TRINITY_DN12539_c0_g1~~TRINITY_DN12539_c0_g1_i2.p1  ORF type:complete len:120 (+),score=35.43 TRINITY_DN12539_c0_g1_i2:168-527(+)